MITLPEKFTYAGSSFEQIKRVGNVALFKRSKATWMGYEVVKIQKRHETTMFGKIVPEHEAMPGSEDWGQSGWTFLECDLKGALAKFNAQVSAQDTNLASRKPKIGSGQRK